MLKDAHAVSFDDLYHQINTCASKPGITQAEILTFAPPLDTIFSTISHQNSITATEFAVEFGLTEVQANQVVDMLVKKGYLAAYEIDNSTKTAFKINYARKKPRKATTNIWKTLDF